MVAGLSLLAGATVAHADTETGLIKVTAFATGAFENDGYAVMMASPDPMGSGRCSGDGNPMFVQLNGEASKALLSTLLAAYTTGKTVTVQYVIDENDACLLGTAQIN